MKYCNILIFVLHGFFFVLTHAQTDTIALRDQVTGKTIYYDEFYKSKTREWKRYEFKLGDKPYHGIGKNGKHIAKYLNQYESSKEYFDKFRRKESTSLFFQLAPAIALPMVIIGYSKNDGLGNPLSISGMVLGLGGYAVGYRLVIGARRDLGKSVELYNASVFD